MAAMMKLLQEIDGIVEEVYNKRNLAEQSREHEYYSAVKIQAWYHGTRIRAYLKHLNKCATCIQRIWRGYLAREKYRVLVKNRVFIMKLNFYNAMATKIQRVWQGYYIRKYVDNYYARKRYLEALSAKNEAIRKDLDEYAEEQAKAKFRLDEIEFHKTQERLARKNHYLVSTEILPGIYNSPFLPYTSEQEMILRSVRPLVRKRPRKKGHELDPISLSYNHPRPLTLPPLPGKPQGPFRNPAEVQQQRYKPFNPTLRVATNYYSLLEARKEMKDEEWVTRLNDNLFKPFYKVQRDYEPFIHTTSKYGHLPYGTKYFREDFPEKHLSKLSIKCSEKQDR